jgi:hypothetical protein
MEADTPHARESGLGGVVANSTKSRPTIYEITIEI